MDKKTRNLIIIGCIVTFIVVPVATVLVLNKVSPKQELGQNDPTPPKSNRSNQEISDAIVNSNSGLANNGEAAFTIDSVKKPQNGWYVALLYLKDDVEKTNPAKVLLYDYGENGGLQVLLGPGTTFTEDDTDAKGVPTEVARELNE